MANETKATPIMQLTPEYLVELMKQARLSPRGNQRTQKPYIDREAEARILALRKQAQQDQRDMLAATAQRKADCPHEKRERNGTTTNKIMLFHNFYDGMPRGICMLCQDVWYPAHWEYRGFQRDRFDVPASQGYEKILELEKFANQSEGVF